jgi:hypothetical protein
MCVDDGFQNVQVLFTDLNFDLLDIQTGGGGVYLQLGDISLVYLSSS